MFLFARDFAIDQLHWITILTKELVINGLSVLIERKSIKHIHLAVYPPDARVHVSAPTECSDERIKMYVLEKWVWLAEKRATVKTYKRQEKREFVSGEAHYFRGSLYRLKVIEDDNEKQGVSINGDYLTLCVHKKSSSDQRGKVMAEWYRQQLEPLLAGYISKWKAELNVTLKNWEIRQMHAKWGTCSKVKSKAIFNLELAKKPPACVEYVVAHELTHLIERTHNENFIKILDSRFHDWREIKRQLNRLPV